jgi:hypothetical protein
MSWVSIATLNVGFGIAAAALWNKYFPKVPKRKDRDRRDEIETDPVSVPEFKASWKNAR